jgi:hypothetical protein
MFSKRKRIKIKIKESTSRKQWSRIKIPTHMMFAHSPSPITKLGWPADWPFPRNWPDLRLGSNGASPNLASKFVASSRRILVEVQTDLNNDRGRHGMVYKSTHLTVHKSTINDRLVLWTSNSEQWTINTQPVIREIFGHHNRLRSLCLQVQPNYMFISSGFPLLNWGIFHKLF